VIAIAWFLIVGGLFVLMALASSSLKRLPLTASMFYLAAGVGLGPLGLGLVSLDPVDGEAAGFLERVTEIAVIVSLFTAGLKLRTPWRDPRWWLPVRLSFVSMTITVGLVAFVGTRWLGLSLGAAVLLGAILAPTDPVLASDVQVAEPSDTDRLRFALTGEAGLNDGTAFPFAMLGLGLLGLHEIGPYGLRWVAVDVVWSVVGGLAIGAALGTVVGRTVVHLRRRHEEAVGLDDFLALGLIALSYGLALLAHTYGFLAVFAAGLALRRIERVAGEEAPGADTRNRMMDDDQLAGEGAATDDATAPAYLARALLGFNEQLERIAEVGVVVIVGALLPFDAMPREALWFIPVLLLIIRPAAVLLGLLGARVTPLQRRMVSWFGIRGIGSIYYLMYAITHDLPGGVARQLASLTLLTIAVSVVVHGVSVTPLMSFYSHRTRRATDRA
jgi:NhaP-type Na+/H+ or K+/H+ antiporter